MALVSLLMLGISEKMVSGGCYLSDVSSSTVISGDSCSKRPHILLSNYPSNKLISTNKKKIAETVSDPDKELKSAPVYYKLRRRAEQES